MISLPWSGALGLYAGVPVVESGLLDADEAFLFAPGYGGPVLVQGVRRSDGFQARQIVREGLADVLEWLRAPR